MNGTAALPTAPATLIGPANGDILWEHPVMTSGDGPEFIGHILVKAIDGWMICAIQNGDIWDGVGCATATIIRLYSICRISLIWKSEPSLQVMIRCILGLFSP